MRRLSILVLSIFVLGGILAAQSKGPALPEQSPRKALLEMLLGGDDAVKKHLTLEVQQKIGDLLSSPTPAGMNPMQALTMARAAGGDNLETFEAGPILFAYNNPAQHQKFEVRIDGDDLRGGEDQMRLSLHSFRDGAEEQLPVLLRFNLAWKAQQRVWRLNAITLSVTLPVGDPRLFDKSKWALPGVNPAVTTGATPASHGTMVSEIPASTGKGPSVVEASVAPARAANPPVAASAGDASSDAFSSSANQPSDTSKMAPLRAVKLIAMAEDIYAKKHPETGYTCFLSELVNVGRGYEDGESYKFMDPQFAQGVYNSYRFSLAGCVGSPARKFQVAAEPVNGSGRAYCSDATHALRGSDDGSAASCLASGKIVQR